jgi:hypothetical protein
VSDLEQTSEGKDNMMNKMNTQEKLEGASSDERKIEFAIDLDQRKRANLNQTSKSKKGRNINYISKGRFTGKASEKSALQFERDEDFDPWPRNEMWGRL